MIVRIKFCNNGEDVIKLDNINFTSKQWIFPFQQGKTATFFQTSEWLSLWWNHFGKGEKLLYSVTDGGNLIGIAPLMQSKRKVQFMGVTPILDGQLVTDFGDIIAKESSEKVVWQMVLKEIVGSSAEFSFIKEDSPTFFVLRDLGLEYERMDVAPYLNLPDSWDEYLSLLSRHQRHELRRKIRKIRREGVVEVCFDQDMEKFFDLMAKSGHNKEHFLSTAMRDFFRDVFLAFYKKEMASLCFLRFGDSYIASVLTFNIGSTVLLYNSGYDPSYASLSPGLVLKGFIIKKSIEEGKKKFEFLRGGERYKYELGGKKRSLVTFRL